MKKQDNKSKVLLLITVILFAVSFFSLSLIPFTDGLEEETQRMVSNIIAVLFYLGLIAGVVFDILANRQIRNSSKKTAKEILEKQKLPGVISFSTDKKNLILYGVLAIGIVIMISDIILNWVESYIMFPIISLTLFLFAVHCIIDGKNYKIYVKTKEGVGNE